MFWEIIHHKDRNKSNNNLGNLEITTTTEHAMCLKCPYYEFYVAKTGNKFIKPEDLTKC